jgi:aminoglycoside phosphotransferase (APT) family kinase protein
MKDVATMPGRLATFLSRHEEGRIATVPHYELMTGGYSRVMAKAHVRWNDGQDETLVLRGDPPPGEAMLETDRDVEWDVLQALTRLNTLSMPAARYYDACAEELGTKCIVLDWATGPSLNSLLREVDDPMEYRDRLVDTLASVHSVRVDCLPPRVERPADWAGYVEKSNALWAETERQLAESDPIMRYVRAWLDANRPPPMELALCHGDFQASNILVDPAGSFQVIDWEYAHIGDPREDLGWYVVYSQSSPPSLYEADPEGFLARYRERTGTDELHVNQATVGYFAVVSTIKVFGGILQAATAMAEGKGASLMTTYNLNAVAVGHMNFLSACSGLAEPLAALRQAIAATSLEVQA